jgi:DNA primase large subunit
LSMSDLPEIVTQVKGKHFHVACTRVYEITHAARGVKKGEGLAGESVTHPNQYAAKSRELEKPKEAAGKIEDDAMKIE